MDTYRATPRTTPTRSPERARHDRATVHAVLDEALVCHLGFVAPDGRPVVLPTIHARVGERLYLHGSTGSRPLRAAPLDVCVTATLVDGLVLARSAFHHSMDYRSVVVHGPAVPVHDPAERAVALDAIVDHVVAGRAADCRPGSRRELAATAVLRVDLDEVSAKVRTGGAIDEPEDLDGPYWAGVVPVRTVLGTPEPDAALPAGAGLPAYLDPVRQR